MPSPELDRLVAIGQLKIEPPVQDELDGLIRTAAVRLQDSLNPQNSPEGRFDLAYNAAHSLALAALRRRGYRPANRYIVFQALAHTLGLPAAQWRVLAKCHEERNKTEYQGFAEVDETLLDNLIEITSGLLDKVQAEP